MKIARNPALEDLLLTQLAASFDAPLPAHDCPAESPRGNEIHLSDLLNVRQNAFKRLMPEPTTPKEAQLWMYGRGFEHEVVRRGPLVPAKSRYYGFPGISYRPDFDEWPGVFSGPIELKWRRANLADDGDEASEYENYLAQIRGYSALGIYVWPHRQAKLIVNTPRQGQSGADHFASTQPATRVYDIEFDVEELDVWRADLIHRAEDFAAVLAHRGTVQAMPLCYDWYCGGRKIETQAKCVECDTELKGAWADRHTSTKKGAGHTVVPPTWSYEARCPWYVFCRPQDTDPTRGAR